MNNHSDSLLLILLFWEYQLSSFVLALEHTIELCTNEKLSDLYKDSPIATQCGLLSA
jgi:hypothetical protein